MVYLDQILHTYACEHCLTTGMCDSFLIDKGQLSSSRVGGHLLSLFNAADSYNQGKGRSLKQSYTIRSNDFVFHSNL